MMLEEEAGQAAGQASTSAPSASAPCPDTRKHERRGESSVSSPLKRPRQNAPGASSRMIDSFFTRVNGEESSIIKDWGKVRIDVTQEGKTRAVRWVNRTHDHGQSRVRMDSV